MVLYIFDVGIFLLFFLAVIEDFFNAGDFGFVCMPVLELLALLTPGSQKFMLAYTHFHKLLFAIYISLNSFAIYTIVHINIETAL
jgi:hypothetical protein